MAQELLSDPGDDELELSDAWKAEISRRCEQINRGEVKLISAEQVFKEAYEALRSV